MTALRVYVACPSAQLERAERLVAAVRAAGHVITEDWPAKVRAAGSANTGMTQEQRRSAVHDCLSGVYTADILIVVPGSMGGGVECGVAYECEIPIVWLGSADASVFSNCSRTCVTSDEEALAAVIDHHVDHVDMSMLDASEWQDVRDKRKTLYVVDGWEPQPESQGGLHVVIASSDEEACSLLTPAGSQWHSYVEDNIRRARRVTVDASEESRVVRRFVA